MPDIHFRYAALASPFHNAAMLQLAPAARSDEAYFLP